MKPVSCLPRLALAGVVLSLMASCAPATPTPTSTSAASADGLIATSGMVVQDAGALTTGASHSAAADPDYALVFPQESVNRVDITITTDQWEALQAEMTAQFGEFGSGQQRGARQPGGQPPQMPATGTDSADQTTPATAGPDGVEILTIPASPGADPGRELPAGNRQPGMVAGNAGGFDFGDTSYVKSTVSFNGQTWQDVGFRYSGNSTLQNSWSSGTLKISFRLDFDQFEDDNPAIQDQRFYGFQQISFKSNAMDDSYLREKVTADLFRKAGVVASQTAFYEVYLDYGTGPTYFGLYTAVEIVDDTVIQTQFVDDSGNVYKPEGSGAAFVEGSFDQDSFEKQTNAKAADWSDIQALFAALHAQTRQSDPAAWRAGLEAVFDVDAFLRWLAVDTIIQNWDTYGSMAHNYYLYNDPQDGLLTWIPWDNNMALSGSGGGQNPDRQFGENGANPPNAGVNSGAEAQVPLAIGGRGFGRGGARELDLAGVGDQWPLISYLAADPVYLQQYQHYLAETVASVWQPEALAARYQHLADLISPYVEKEAQGFTQLESYVSFEQGLQDLITHAQQRYDAVQAYLAGE